MTEVPRSRYNPVTKKITGSRSPKGVARNAAIQHTVKYAREHLPEQRIGRASTGKPALGKGAKSKRRPK